MSKVALYSFQASGVKPICKRTHQNDFVFSRKWHPSAFQLFKFDFLGTYWSDASDFCINTTTGWRSIIFQTFGGRNFFARTIGDKSLKFFDFLNGQWYIFESRFYSKLGNANVFALIDVTPFIWAACCDRICPKIFFWPVFVKKKQHFDFFRNRLDIPHCPVRFLTLKLCFLKCICRI